MVCLYPTGHAVLTASIFETRTAKSPGLKTGAINLRIEPHAQRAESFALPVCSFDLPFRPFADTPFRPFAYSPTRLPLRLRSGRMNPPLEPVHYHDGYEQHAVKQILGERVHGQQIQSAGQELQR